MKLFEAFSERGYHTSFLTTFSLDFPTYESLALSRLRGSGCINNIVVVDSRMLTMALDEVARPPKFAGHLYSVSPAISTKGVFHPKLFLQVGRQQARLVVSSANMTSAGIAGNLEITGQVVCGVEPSAEQNVIARAWRYIARYVDQEQPSIARQLRWTLDRAQWLEDVLAQQSINAPDTENIDIQLLTSGESFGITQMFAAAVAEDQIRRLCVISPYWDHDLSALKELHSRLKPEKTVVLIQKNRKLFPGDQAAKLEWLRVVDVDSSPIARQPNSRFAHAKVFIAEGLNTDHVLFGSANCTGAALGIDNGPGNNQEASLYVRLPAGQITESLDLKLALDAGGLSQDELLISRVQIDDTIPLEEAAARSPGRFELHQTTLTWWPPVGLRNLDPIEAAGRLTLYSIDFQSVAFEIRPIGRPNSSVFSFTLVMSEGEPRFASVDLGESRQSANAIITWADQLRRSSKEARSAAIDRALDKLQDESEEGLWFLDLVDVIHAFEDSAAGKNRKTNQVGAPIAHTTLESTPAHPTRLSYEEFLRGRMSHGKVGFRVERSSVSESNLAYARSFLNRILNFEAFQLQSAEVDVNLGPDESVSQSSSNSGNSSESKVASTPGNVGGGATNGKQSVLLTKKAALVARDQLVQAVVDFNKKCRETEVVDGLNEVHALKLRAMLMLIAASGTAKSEREMNQGRQDLRGIQVLASDGDHSWQRLMGMLLFSFFAQTPPCVLQFRLDASMEQVPDDYLECWATCYWAALARVCLLDKSTSGRPLVIPPKDQNLITRTYALTGLRSGELLEGTIPEIMQVMNGRFAARLGIDPVKIFELHRAHVTPANAIPKLSQSGPNQN